MSKYDIGEFVLYGTSGSCEIVKIGTLDFTGPDKIYYSLKPVFDSRSTIYVPVEKEDEIVRRAMSKAEVDKMIKSFASYKALKGPLEKDKCEIIIKSGDNEKITGLIKYLRDMRNENRKSHKGLNIAEERLLRDAERVIYSEISSAYNISVEEVTSKYSELLD